MTSRTSKFTEHGNYCTLSILRYSVPNRCFCKLPDSVTNWHKIHLFSLDLILILCPSLPPIADDFSLGRLMIRAVEITLTSMTEPFVVTTTL